MNQEIRRQQLSIIDGQLLGCILYIVTLVISIIIVFNQRQKAVGNEEYLTGEDSQNLALINRVVILLLILWFLYLNYKAKSLAEETNQDTSGLILQVAATIISLLPAIISLYVIVTNFSNSSLQTAEIENPFD